MSSQKRAGYTLEDKYRVALLTDARLLSRILSAHLAQEPLRSSAPESIRPSAELTPGAAQGRQPSRAPPPPPRRGNGNLDHPSAIRHAVVTSRPPPPSASRPPPPPAAVSRPPPPPSMRPKPTAPEPEAAVGEAKAEGAQKPESTSVIISLAELQRIEAERVAEEKAKKEAEELKELEAAINELALQEARGKLTSVLKGRMESEKRRIADECDALEREEAARANAELESATDALLDSLEEQPAGGQKEKSISIEITVEFGLPWDEEHAEHELSDHELVMSQDLLPECQARWVLPVPPEDTKDKAERELRRMFRDSETARLAGKFYYITDDRDVPAYMRRIVRIGNKVHVWADGITDYGFLDGEKIYENEAAWPKNFDYLDLTDRELGECAKLIPEGLPRWLHPVPNPESGSDVARTIFAQLALRPRVTIRGREFAILDVQTVGDWRNTVLQFPSCRIASRTGRVLTLAKQEQNGEKIFFNSNNSHEEHYGIPGYSMKPEEDYVKPYDNEIIHVSKVYEGGKERWLVLLPEKISEMSSSELHFIITQCNKRIGVEERVPENQERNTELPDGVSPLVSIQGRWYAAMPIVTAGGRKTDFDEELGMVHFHPEKVELRDTLKAMKIRSIQVVEDKKDLEIQLPTDMNALAPWRKVFPEGEIRYLLPVDPKSKFEQVKPYLGPLRRRDGTEWGALVLDRPYEGAVPVKRFGTIIREVSAESIPPEHLQGGEGAADMMPPPDAPAMETGDESAVRMRITRVTKYFKNSGDFGLIGSGYRLELVSAGRDSLTFNLESKAEGYKKSLEVKRGREWSETVRGEGDLKITLEWEGPSEAGNYKVRIAITQAAEETAGPEPTASELLLQAATGDIVPVSEEIEVDVEEGAKEGTMEITTGDLIQSVAESALQGAGAKSVPKAPKQQPDIFEGLDGIEDDSSPSGTMQVSTGDLVIDSLEDTPIRNPEDVHDRKKEAKRTQKGMPPPVPRDIFSLDDPEKK